MFGPQRTREYHMQGRFSRPSPRAPVAPPVDTRPSFALTPVSVIRYSRSLSVTVSYSDLNDGVSVYDDITIVGVMTNIGGVTYSQTSSFLFNGGGTSTVLRFQSMQSNAIYQFAVSSTYRINGRSEQLTHPDERQVMRSYRTANVYSTGLDLFDTIPSTSPMREIVLDQSTVEQPAFAFLPGESGPISVGAMDPGSDLLIEYTATPVTALPANAFLGSIGFGRRSIVSPTNFNGTTRKFNNQQKLQSSKFMRGVTYDVVASMVSTYNSVDLDTPVQISSVKFADIPQFAYYRLSTWLAERGSDAILLKPFVNVTSYGGPALGPTAISIDPATGAITTNMHQIHLSVPDTYLLPDFTNSFQISFRIALSPVGAGLGNQRIVGIQGVTNLDGSTDVFGFGIYFFITNANTFSVRIRNNFGTIAYLHTPFALGIIDNQIHEYSVFYNYEKRLLSLVFDGEVIMTTSHIASRPMSPVSYILPSDFYDRTPMEFMFNVNRIGSVIHEISVDQYVTTLDETTLTLAYNAYDTEIFIPKLSCATGTVTGGTPPVYRGVLSVHRTGQMYDSLLATRKTFTNLPAGDFWDSTGGIENIYAGNPQDAIGSLVAATEYTIRIDIFRQVSAGVEILEISNHTKYTPILTMTLPTITGYTHNFDWLTNGFRLNFNTITANSPSGIQQYYVNTRILHVRHDNKTIFQTQSARSKTMTLDADGTSALLPWSETFTEDMFTGVAWWNRALYADQNHGHGAQIEVYWRNKLLFQQRTLFGSTGIDLRGELWVDPTPPPVLNIDIASNGNTSFDDSVGNSVTTLYTYTFDGAGNMITGANGFKFKIEPTDWNTFLPLRSGLVLTLAVTIPPGTGERFELRNIAPTYPIRGYNGLPGLLVLLHGTTLFFRGYIVGGVVFNHSISTINLYDALGNQVIIDNVPHVWRFDYLLTPYLFTHVAETTIYCDGVSIGHVNHVNDTLNATARQEGYVQPIGSSSYYDLQFGTSGTTFRTFTLRTY